MNTIVKAKATGVRISPRKVGVVASLVRGRSVADAITILEHTPRRAAIPVSKLVKSVAANADVKGLDAKTLTIESIVVGPGFAMKRFRPAAHGRALPYKKQSSNIAIEVSGAAKVKKTEKKAEKKTPAKKAATSAAKKESPKAKTEKES